MNTRDEPYLTENIQNMNHTNKKVVGVWLDHKQAMIIATSNQESEGEYGIIKKISAQHHSDHSSSEDAHHKKASQEVHKLYEAISHEVSAHDEIYITGPGTAQEELKNFLAKDMHFKNKEISLGTSDHPTENQMIAEVRDHFQK
jgi:stalled ribosome rescue protein Dom34